MTNITAILQYYYKRILVFLLKMKPSLQEKFASLQTPQGSQILLFYPMQSLKVA
jgi:hypothetical protein